MPELPEVESFKNYLRKYALKKKIIKATTYDQYLLKNISKTNLEKALQNNMITETTRKGKYLACTLDKEGYMIFHFGMTGYFEYFKNPSQKPKFVQLLLELEKGYFAFVCKRKLGRILLVDDAKQFFKEKKIGADALAVRENDFIELLKKKKGNIKTALMDQTLIAGVGNEYSDEILYQAKVHPNSKTASLPDRKLSEIYYEMQAVLKYFIAHNAERGELGKYFLVENRKAGIECPGGGKISKETISGRSSYFCPQQKLYS